MPNVGKKGLHGSFGKDVKGKGGPNEGQEAWHGSMGKPGGTPSAPNNPNAPASGKPHCNEGDGPFHRPAKNKKYG